MLKYYVRIFVVRRQDTIAFWLRIFAWATLIGLTFFKLGEYFAR